MSILCSCKDPISVTGTENSLLALDYYDGPVSGILCCIKCRSTFGFEMIDWTADHRIRLWMLFTIAESDFQTSQRLLQQLPAASPLNESDYKLVKSLIRPKAVPDGLLLWNNERVQALTEVPISGIPDSDVWTPWLEASLTTDWFAKLNIRLPTS